MICFGTFFSGELDPYSIDAWWEIAPDYRVHLTNLAKHVGPLSIDCGLSYIPTIYRDFEGIKPRLYFSRKDSYIDYRPLIQADEFSSMLKQERMNLITSLLPKITKKTHLIGLNDSEKTQLDKIFNQPFDYL